eukprot:scaffold305_cov110-Cylindrotheca_fusiformis.AAC.19
MESGVMLLLEYLEENQSRGASEEIEIARIILWSKIDVQQPRGTSTRGLLRNVVSFSRNHDGRLSRFDDRLRES